MPVDPGSTLGIVVGDRPTRTLEPQGRGCVIEDLRILQGLKDLPAGILDPDPGGIGFAQVDDGNASEALFVQQADQ